MIRKKKSEQELIDCDATMCMYIRRKIMQIQLNEILFQLILEIAQHQLIFLRYSASGSPIYFY